MQEEEAKLESEDEEYEDSAGDDTKDEPDDEQTKGNDIVSSRKKTPELLSLRLFRYVRVQKRRLITFPCSLLTEQSESLKSPMKRGSR